VHYFSKALLKLDKGIKAKCQVRETEYRFEKIWWQAERQEHQEMIDEKHSKALLKNTLDPLLSQLTKVAHANLKEDPASRERLATEIEADKKGQERRALHKINLCGFCCKLHYCLNTREKPPQIRFG
jgi:hypothetical protein